MTDRKNEIRRYLEYRLKSILERRKDSSRRAELANLRKGVGKAPGELPELWGVVLAGLPEEFLSKNTEPTREEWAIYTALTLFAVHQQSKDVPMHSEENTLGTAISRLVENEDDRERVARRFYAFATSTDMREASYHLRGLISQLRGKGIPMNYVKLASDLYDYQWSEESRARVRLAWGQDFYRTGNKSDEK